MKISIITATYNSEESIVDTVRSLHQQDFPRDDIEWILVDGASTDDTLKRIQAEKFHPDLWVSEPDKGLSDALNKGVAMATGDVIGVLHAGDMLASRGILYQIYCAFNNSGADAIYGDLNYGRPSENGDFKGVHQWTAGIYYHRNLRWGWLPPHPTFYLKREVYEQTKLEKGVYFDPTYTCSAHDDFMMRVLGKYKIEPAYLRMVLVKMRIDKTSPRNPIYFLTQLKEDWQAIRRNQIGHGYTLVGKNIQKLERLLIRSL